MSTAELIDLFHHRWAPPALALLGERGGARFVELQRRLDVGRESLKRALDALVEQGLVRRNSGYGHPLRPEYVPTPKGRAASALAVRVLAAGDETVVLHKWPVPVLQELGDGRRFSQLHAALATVTPRALALALQELERHRLVRRDVLPTRPPSTLYRPTARGRRVQAALRGEDDLDASTRV
jgi:DNA-binding HxlR family transcriptional regulator